MKSPILRWLWMPVYASDSICPLCDGVLDKFGDHCLTCPCGGDRTKRHNHLRNHVYSFATAAGLDPVLEKPGLLQSRPFQGSLPENGVQQSNPQARRPADVWLPRWRHGNPVALDFAVTSGLLDTAATIQEASACLTAYEQRKRTHLDTERLCNAEGLGFTPMVMEAVGGTWGPAASPTLVDIAKVKALQSGESQEYVLQQLLQCLSTILHRENARAVLRRSRVYTAGSAALLAASTTLQADAAAPEFQFQ